MALIMHFCLHTFLWEMENGQKVSLKITFSVQQIVEQYLSQVFGGTRTENTKRRLTPTLKVWALNHKIVGYNSNISTIENAPLYSTIYIPYHAKFRMIWIR